MLNDKIAICRDFLLKNDIEISSRLLQDQSRIIDQN